MFKTSNQNKQITQLPPSFEQFSQFQFGKLTIQLNIEQLQQLNIRSIKFQFLGGISPQYKCQIGKKLFYFPIRTSLWHFYNYLKDMSSIRVYLTTTDNQVFSCLKQVQLLSTQKVMNKSYMKGNYIVNCVQLCDIFSQNQESKGYVMVKTKIQFDQDIHKQIADLIDFGELQNNPQQICQDTQESQIKVVKSSGSIKRIINPSNSTNSNPYKNQQNQPNFSNIIQYNLSQIKCGYQQQSQQIEDDIDRMIAQMQNKPYDSSRYLDNTSKNSFINTQLSKGFQQRRNMHLNESSSNNNMRGDSRNQYQRSISPHNLPKYPQIPMPNRGNNIQNFGNTTISNQRSLSPGMNSRNRSLNRTQQTSFQNTMKSFNNHSMIQKHALCQNTGNLKIQIHELLGRDLEDEGFNLKVYINDENNDIFNCKGSQQGEVIVYNQKVEVTDCILNQIYKIRFQLQNWQNQTVYSADFQLTRLLNIPKLQGIFMLNLHPVSQQFYGNSLIASQSILKKIQKVPTQRTLRVTISFSQQVQIVQLYLNMSKFSLDYKKCKYKIPFTKQTVQFDPTQTHFNIFPHSKAYTKLIIEFWNSQSIIGATQINLQNLKNITKSILQCNIQPIYLYDCMMPIKNLFNQNQVGKFKILVCCGNVRQVQHVLNKNMQNLTLSKIQSEKTFKNPVEVEYNQKLGVFIKDRKNNQQIQIQVDPQEFQNSKKYHKQTQKQNEELHAVSMLSQNEFLSQKNAQPKGLSKIHSMVLDQQKQDDSQNEEEIVNLKVQNKSKMLQNSKKASQQKCQKQVKQKQLAKVLKNLSQNICQKIKECFKPLSQDNFLVYQQLKSVCKPHLLFNFLDIDILIKSMMEIGISKFSINEILQILQPLNGMINFNILNDFMVSLQVQGVIRENLVPVKLFIKFALSTYYASSCKQIQRQLTQSVQSDKFDYNQWLSDKILSLISTLDQSVDFNQIRKLFTCIGFKISLNEYNILKSFLQNQAQIKSFLFELAQSKTAYESIIKSHKNIFQILKLSLIEEIVTKRKNKELNQKYEENILDHLYSSKLYGKNNESKLEESFMSSKNSSNYAFSSRQNILQPETQSIQSNIKLNQPTYFHKKQITKQIQSQDDDDDFIINGLNAKSNTINQDEFQEKQKFYSGVYKTQNLSNLINVQKYKEKQPQITISKSGQTLISYTSKRTITVQGLQNCKSTYQCQMDQQLQSPYIKVIIQTPYDKKIYFKSSDLTNSQQFQIKSSLKQQEEEVEGQILLNDITKKGEISVAAARFLAIKGIKSVYALKTYQQEAFCGLVNILIQ